MKPELSWYIPDGLSLHDLVMDSFTSTYKSSVRDSFQNLYSSFIFCFQKKMKELFTCWYFYLFLSIQGHLHMGFLKVFGTFGLRMLRLNWLWEMKWRKRSPSPPLDENECEEAQAHNQLRLLKRISSLSIEEIDYDEDTDRGREKKVEETEWGHSDVLKPEGMRLNFIKLYNN